jgi:type IV secretory pathway VirJ component
MRFHRPARAFAVLVLASAGILTAQAASEAVSTVPVKTSRGEYDLMLYAPKVDRGKPPVFLISGEGGWRRFDQMLAGFFSDAGHWVGGMDSLKYFWHAQDDREALSKDVRSYVRELEKAAGRPPGSKVILAGFSFGADLAPWIAGAGGWGNQIAGLVMLGPDQTGSLQFRVLEVFGVSQKDHIFPVSQALESVKDVPVLFIHGGKDPHSDAPPLFKVATEPKKLLTVPDSDHHFSGHEEGLRAALVKGLQWVMEADSPDRGSGGGEPR